MSKSTNTKNLRSKIVLFRILCDSDLADRDAGVITQDEYAKSIDHRLDILIEYIAKDHQQLIQRIKEEVIGKPTQTFHEESGLSDYAEMEVNIAVNDLISWVNRGQTIDKKEREWFKKKIVSLVPKDIKASGANELRQTQREILETMEKE